MNNLDFTNIRRIIIDNIEDDKEARELILKITDMELVRDMRKEVINSIQDLDILDAVLQEIQLTESLVVDDDEIDLELEECLNNFEESLNDAGGFKGLFDGVKSMIPDNLFKYRFNLEESAMIPPVFTGELEDWAKMGYDDLDFIYGMDLLTGTRFKTKKEFDDFNKISQKLYKNAMDFIRENQHMMKYKIDFEGNVKTIEEIARQAFVKNASIIKTEREDGLFDVKVISVFASGDVIESIMKKTKEEVENKLK